MAPKTGPSLRELMKGRNKAPSPQEKRKSKPLVNPPPQFLADLRLKPNPDLRRKRHTEAPEEGEWALPKEANSHGNHRTKGAGGPALLTAKRSFLWLKCAVQPTLGRLSWRWMVCPLPGMLPSGITVGGMPIMQLRPWSSPSSSQKIWRLTRTSTTQSSFYPLKGIWLW